MITAVHIEDEPRNVQLLLDLIAANCPGQIEMLGNAGSLPEAIKLIKEKKPELVFLDIEINEGNAFELLDQIDPINFEVIFITAYNEYAVKAFRVNAIDYILKPISKTELKDSIERAVLKVNTRKLVDNKSLKSARILAGTELPRLSISTSDGTSFINPEEIIRIEAMGSYSKLYLKGGSTIVSTKNLKFIEQHLPENLFLRVHHSWVINLNFLKKYNQGKNGCICMADDSNIPVSVRKRGKLLDQM